MRLIFFGTPAFSVSTLEQLIADGRYDIAAVITQPDRAAGRGQKLTPSPVKRCALEHGLHVLQPTSIRKESATFMEQLRQLGPLDAGVVVAFGQILPSELLALPRRGCINVHASLLPRWRGAAPIQRAILAGDSESGVCIMQMEPSLDTGPVFAVERVAIAPTDSAEHLHDKLAGMGAQLLCRTLPSILDGSARATPQSTIGVTYAEKIRPEEAEIHWELPAKSLERLVCGFAPSPGAYTSLHGQRLKIFQARALSRRNGSSDTPPGTISLADGSALEIVCGTDCLAVSELQLAGKRRMTVGEFLRGGSVTTGVRLGS